MEIVRERIEIGDGDFSRSAVGASRTGLPFGEGCDGAKPLFVWRIGILSILWEGCEIYRDETRSVRQCSLHGWNLIVRLKFLFYVTLLLKIDIRRG